MRTNAAALLFIVRRIRIFCVNEPLAIFLHAQTQKVTVLLTVTRKRVRLLYYVVTNFQSP